MGLPTSLQRSQMMSRIRAKNTRPELVLRKALFAAGFRYRLHQRGLPGSPDLVFPKYKAALFVHGCFWHRHGGCRYTTTPKTKVGFWNLKFEGNVNRDARTVAALHDAGWRVAVVWECALNRSLDEVREKVSNWLLGDDKLLTVG